MRTLVLAVIFIAQSAPGQRVSTFVTSPLVMVRDSVGDTTRMSSHFTDAKRLSNRRIVAAVCGANELRAYDASGKPIGSISFQENPGPQRFLIRLFPAGGDTVGAFESLNTRLTLIDPSFKVLRTVSIPNPDTSTFNGRPRPARLDVIGRFSDGSFVARGTVRPDTSVKYGFDRPAISLYRFSAAGAFLDSVTIPGREGLRIAGQRSIQVPRLARGTSLAIDGERLLVGDQTLPFISEYSLKLVPMNRVETITRPTLMTDSIRAAWTRIETAGQLTPTNGVLSVYATVFAPQTPAFGDLVTGTDGRLWVQDPQGADHYPLLWTAYKEGQPVARAELPPRFYPTQFGPDWVLGLAYDTTPVDRLQVLKLTPGPLTNVRLTPKEAAPANRPRCGAWTSR
jgi:hypothetical protein